MPCSLRDQQGILIRLGCFNPIAPSYSGYNMIQSYAHGCFNLITPSYLISFLFIFNYFHLWKKYGDFVKNPSIIIYNSMRCIQNMPSDPELRQRCLRDWHTVPVLFESGCPSNTRHWTNVGLMLTHRLWSCLSIILALGHRLLFTGFPHTVCR